MRLTTVDTTTNERHDPLATTKRHKAELRRFVHQVEPTSTKNEHPKTLVASRSISEYAVIYCYSVGLLHYCRVAIFLLTLERGRHQARNDLRTLGREFKAHQRRFERNAQTEDDVQHFEYYDLFMVININNQNGNTTEET